MASRERRNFNYAKTIRLSALLFLLLGLANVWYGERRSSRYENLLAAAEAQLSDPNSNKEQQLKYVRRLKSRLVFASVVETGGRALLGVSLLLMVGGLLIPSATTANLVEREKQT